MSALSDNIMIALITLAGTIVASGLTLVGVIVTVKSQGKKQGADIEKKLEIHQAVTDTKIDELTYEVRRHNDFATKIPQLKSEIEAINEKINIYHRKG